MKHCKGCSHPTTCNTLGCGAEEARANKANAAHESPRFTGVAERKLNGLLTSGYGVNGVAIRNDATGQQGFVTDGGIVGWWQPESDAQMVKAQRDELLGFARIVLRGLEDGHINAVRKQWNGKQPDVLSLKEATRAAIAKAEGKEGGAA